MPAAASGAVKTGTVRRKQKNGDIYVYERKTRYDPEKQYNVVLSSRLLGKIPKGGTELVPTAPRRPKRENAPDAPVRNPSGRRKAWMTAVLDHVGNMSGIDEAVTSAADPDTARKILSLARYLLAADGQSLSRLSLWQLSHPLPCEEELSEEVCRDLFRKTGCDEALMRRFFASRMGQAPSAGLLAYDTVAGTGCPGADGSPGSIRLLTLYCAETHQPVAFTKLSGALPFAAAVEDALSRLRIPGAAEVEVVTNRGYGSEEDLAGLLHARLPFLTPADLRLKWIRDELDARAEELHRAESACPFDPAVHAVTVTRVRSFPAPAADSSPEEHRPAGNETFRRRVYLHLYFSEAWKTEQDGWFDLELDGLTRLAGKRGLPEETAGDIRRYLRVHRRGGKMTAERNEAAVAERKKSHGYFALVSDRERDPFRCLLRYRGREKVLSFFESGAPWADEPGTEFRFPEYRAGLRFVQFVALCGSESLSGMLRGIIATLKRGSRAPGGPALSETERNLLGWLERRPSSLVLSWFDARERAGTTGRPLPPEIERRDRLFFEMLGIPEP